MLKAVESIIAVITVKWHISVKGAVVSRQLRLVIQLVIIIIFSVLKL